MGARAHLVSLREKSADDLKGEIVELHKEAFKLRLQQSTSQTSNTARFKAIRREVARIKTLLKEAPKVSAQPTQEATSTKGSE